uniref:FISNA domain-containing protein n=1 Tax=Astyanax mexicanus TaxID=7994 RepID=A0A3B1IK45_ASTMX
FQVLQDLDTLCLLEQTLNNIDKEQFIRYLCKNYPECIEPPLENYDVHDISKYVLEKFGSEGALKITLKIILEKGILKTFRIVLNLHYKIILNLNLNAYVGNSHKKFLSFLNEIFTKLLITEGESGGVNREHEVRQIEELTKSKDIQENEIKCNALFNPVPGQRKRIRTVLTKGIAGIGKTVSENQDIHFMFPLPFRDLNLKRHNRFSLIQLLHQYFPELKELKNISSEETKTLFIFDGLDECRLPLDFKNNEMCCDLTQEMSVDVLLTNLIMGNILPSALLWITSRPAAASQIPPECIDQVTEVRGFNDSEKEEYFRKRFNKPGLADKIVVHIKSSRSLHIMCHIPVFCWISSTVLEERLDKSDCADVPKTLTQMYTHFLLIQTHSKNKKYHGLEKGNLIFYEKDLTECGIDVSTASEYSAICTEIFKEEFGIYRERVFCFVHLSIQEHLAAVYVHLECVNNNKNILNVHKSAVDRALQSENGQFDLFLRFLLGLSLQSNQALLSRLLSKHCEESSEETVTYIKEKIRNESSAERSINLFHCLNELNYNSLVEEIRNFLSSDRQSETELKPDQCSALAYVLLTSEDVMEEFDLKMCNTSTEGYRRLLPVLFLIFRSLAGANLTDESCESLASVLQSSNSHLTELDLSFNSLGDLGVKLLCTGLSDPHCKLEKLNLSYNDLEYIGMKLLCDCLRSPHCKLQILRFVFKFKLKFRLRCVLNYVSSANSNLKELDLGCNNMRDSGVKLLSAGLISLNCKLQKLGLDRCDLTHESCEVLTTALQSPNSCMKELDLSYNKLGDDGVKLLCNGLTHPNCKLVKLDLSYNNLDRCCSNLASVLSFQSYLRELELRDNGLQDSGVKLLCIGLLDPQCKLQRLG